MDELEATVERYDVGEEDLQYVLKAVNKHQAMKINASFEQDARKTIEDLGDSTYLSVHFSNDDTVTLRDPLQLYRPQPDHINSKAIAAISSFTVCEPYLYQFTDGLGEFRYFLRRWTISLIKQMCPTRKHYIWAIEPTDHGETGEWQVLESHYTGQFTASIVKTTQAEIVDDVKWKLTETLSYFNGFGREMEITPELFWSVRNDMKSTTFCGYGPRGGDVQKPREYGGMSYWQRSREEAIRVYRTANANANGIEPAWKEVPVL